MEFSQEDERKFGEEEFPRLSEEVPQSFFSYENLKVGQTCIFSGLLCGYGSAYVGAYTTLYDMSENCNLYKQQSACVTLSNARCSWTSDTTMPCVWRDALNCFQEFTTAASCTSHSSCTWSYSASHCENKHGYGVVEEGVFAASMVTGCMISCFFNGALCRLLGLKRMLLLAGILGLIACVGYHLSTALTLFWLLVVSRVILGCANGMCTVASTVYVNINAHPRYAQKIGMLFQLFSCFGVFFGSLVGLMVGQTINVDSDSNAHLKARMQGFSAGATLTAVLLVGLGIWVPKGKPLTVTEESEEEPNSEERKYTYIEMLPRLLVGVTMAATLQLTGFNAVMNFAPTIMEEIGMQPFPGNVLVMGWTAATTVVSIPLASVASMRTLFLWSCLGASLSCIFLCGIPVWPDVANNNVKNGVGITGILMYICLFEFGVGPAFYVLSQDIFPRTFRPKGSSFMNLVQFFFTILINGFYPTATTTASGGAAGNQNRGQAIAFIFFGVVGIICFGILFFFMHPWEERIPLELDTAGEDNLYVADEKQEHVSGHVENSISHEN